MASFYLFFSPKYADDIAVLHSSEEVKFTLGNWGMVGGDTIVEHLHGKHLPRCLQKSKVILHGHKYKWEEYKTWEEKSPSNSVSFFFLNNVALRKLIILMEV